MAFEIDPLYHTESMVRILRDQGSTQHAAELARSILAKDPSHEGVKALLAQLEAEAREAFERFRQAGRGESSANSPQQGSKALGIELGDSTEKIDDLLKQIQDYRASHDKSEA